MTGITRHSALLILSFLITALLNYAFGVLLSWFFTPAQFGVLGVAQSLLLVMALVVGSGFAWTAAHDLAAGGVNGDTRRRFRAAWAANALLGALLAGGVWLAYTTRLLPLGESYALIVPLLGLTTLLLAARSVINGAARGLYRFGALAFNLTAEVAIKAGAGLALVAAGFGVAGAMGGFAIGALAALLHSLWMVRPARLWRGGGWFSPSVLRATLPFFAGMLGPVFILNFDLLGLKLLSPAGTGDELAGFYQAAVILARTPVFVAQSLTVVLFSYVAGAKHAAASSPSAAGAYLATAIRAWGFLLLPGGLVLMLAPDAALTLFFPPPYRAASAALQISAAGSVLLALVMLLNGVFQAGEDRRRPALTTTLAVAAQLIALVELVPRYGTVGAALSLLLAGGVALAGLLPPLVPLLRRTAWRGWGLLPRLLLPLLALALPLLMLPGEQPAAAALKFGLAGLAYLATMVAVHASLLARARPASVGGAVMHFVQMLMGV